MRVDLFDFELPEGAVALRPSRPREAARLMAVAPDGARSDHTIGDLPDLLRPGDALVVNDTRVIPARLEGTRSRPDGGDARVEVTLHMRLGPDRWRAFARPAKRLAAGDRVAFASPSPGPALSAEVSARRDAEVELVFDREGPALDEALAASGIVPLPPYIARRRPADRDDAVDYQTVYAAEPGAVAAPTAGLHLSDAMLARLTQAGIGVHRVTLHVGAGTFLPVTADDTAGHVMHEEIGHLDATVAERLNQTRRSGGRIVSVGTTSLRLLESATSADGEVLPFSGPTDIFITPGYRFKAVDVLLTNFHTPRSTLFMLVCAFSGLDRMQAAYRHAIASGYRFYSYGDACWLERART